MTYQHDAILTDLSVNPTRVKILELSSYRSLSPHQILVELEREGYAPNENSITTHINHMVEDELVERRRGQVHITKVGSDILKIYREREKK